MMKHKYEIDGMTCEGCYYKVKGTLEAIEGVSEALVDWKNGSAEIQMDNHVSTATMESALQAAGQKYHIRDAQPSNMDSSVSDESQRSFLETYKPLFLIVLFIAGTTGLSQYPFASFDTMLWMRHFMAGFFIVFAFFKLLNLNGFANSYAMYDIVAAKWSGWGFVYPFVELALGVAYLVNFNPTITNWATIVVLGVSSIGVIESNLNKRKIKCACLGDVFNLPMSTVTIVEDLSMVAMAVFMLL
jgi:copper chaperone CopZ